MLTWVSGLYNDHLIQYHLFTVVCLSLPPLTNGVISYSDQTLGLKTVATYTVPVTLATLSMEAVPGFVGVMECGVGQL